MATNDLPYNERVLDTRIPERHVDGLEYGRHVSTPRWTGYYVRPEGSALPMMVARLDPTADDPDLAELEDEIATRSTEAERVAAAYCDDGQRFAHPVSGQPLDEYCEETGGFFAHPVGLDRYEFADGSAIVIADGGWDIEGNEPFTWRG